MRHRRKEGNHETCRTAPARSVKRMRAFFYYVGNIAQRYFRNNDKSILRSGAHGWEPYAHRNLRFRDARFCPYFNERQSFDCLFLFCRNPAASLLSERMVSCDSLCGIAARKETMKLAGLRLRVIWTLPVFYYLDLHKIEIKNCARVCLFSYLNLGTLRWHDSNRDIISAFMGNWRNCSS